MEGVQTKEQHDEIGAEEEEEARVVGHRAMVEQPWVRFIIDSFVSCGILIVYHRDVAY